MSIDEYIQMYIYIVCVLKLFLETNKYLKLILLVLVFCLIIDN